MDGGDRLEVRRIGVDGLPQGELVLPDPTAVWPMVASIQEVWLEADDPRLVVVGLRGPTTVLHSLDVDESPAGVGLLALVAFPVEVARSMAERSQQPGLILPGLRWRAEVRLQRPLDGRPVHDRGPQVPLNQGSMSDDALARLRVELQAATAPAERRRIRQAMKAIRLNPLKASPLPDRK